MEKSKKLIFVIGIVICLIILTTSSPNPEHHPERYYIALGDSVSTGYGLAANEGSYSKIFYELLKNEGYIDNYINLAVNGFTTTLLLEYLKNIDAENLDILKTAHIVTLNIGGNNILLPFLGYFSNLEFLSGAGTIRSGAEGIISGALNIISGIRSGTGNSILDLDESRSAVTNVISGIGNIITGIGSIISGTGEIVSGSPDVLYTLSGSFSHELRNELEKGVRAFSEEFKEIITLIKTYAPNATLIVNTIYNPIPQDILRSSLEISVAANAFIESMNNIIIQESRLKGFLVTDIYTPFSNQLNMMNFNINPFAGNLSFDIVHPNADGHKLIAQLNYETFMQK